MIAPILVRVGGCELLKRDFVDCTDRVSGYNLVVILLSETPLIVVVVVGRYYLQDGHSSAVGSRDIVNRKIATARHKIIAPIGCANC